MTSAPTSLGLGVSGHCSLLSVSVTPHSPGLSLPLQSLPAAPLVSSSSRGPILLRVQDQLVRVPAFRPGDTPVSRASPRPWLPLSAQRAALCCVPCPPHPWILGPAARETDRPRGDSCCPPGAQLSPSWRWMVSFSPFYQPCHPPLPPCQRCLLKAFPSKGEDGKASCLGSAVCSPQGGFEW